MSGLVTALYDCRSKQEYIYRTNRINEISGGSDLLATLYYRFVKLASENHHMKIKCDWKGDWECDWKLGCDFSLDSFKNSDLDAEVLYVGGGNLLIIYRDEQRYIKANKILSRMLLDETYTVSIIASKVDTTENFIDDRKKLYQENRIKKNTRTFTTPCNTLPFTQVDRLTYMPIVEKDFKKQESHSRESKFKLKSYNNPLENYDSKYADMLFQKELKSLTKVKNLDDMTTKKGIENLLAVIYIDGNNMGQKVKDATKKKNGYTECVTALRKFSINTDTNFIRNPINAINEYFKNYNKDKNDEDKRGYRLVISSGDEITLICNARMALPIVKTYFDTLIAKSNSDNSNNSACAGIAIFHSHAPFADVYEIAEQCCESGKKRAHKNPGKNYIDFHFCHAGITNELEAVRDFQEMGITSRPYEYVEEFKKFCDMGEKLKNKDIGRSNVKALSDAIVKGYSYFRYEVSRINSRVKGKDFKLSDTEEEMKLIYDVSLIYDIWFSENGIQQEGAADE